MKIPIDVVKNEIEKYNYKFLCIQKIYNRNYYKVICPNNHMYYLDFSSFKNGNRCQRCYILSKREKSLEKLNIIAFQNRFKVLSSEFDNRKIKFLCPKKHIFFMRNDSFLKSKRCPKCSYNKRKEKFKNIRESLNKEGYQLLSKRYKNDRTKLKVKCPNGHIYDLIFSMFKSGFRCRECWKLSCFGCSNPNWKNGNSFIEYCPIWFDKDFKKSILERDNKKCLNPFCNKKISKLTVHHIDYDKKNCNPNNLITLCSSCNCFANKDRDWHFFWYKAILFRRYKI
jgi:hypothetical protein